MNQGQNVNNVDSVMGSPIKQLSAVEVSLNQMHGSIGDITELIARLTKRLEPILTPAPVLANGTSGGGGCGAQPVPETPCQLVSRVDGMSQLIRADHAALRELERRLAI